MSTRSYTKIWLHLVWSTHNRKKSLINKDLRKAVSSILYNYAQEKNIYMKTNYVNSKHVHSVVDLPTHLSIEKMMRLIKGGFFLCRKQDVQFQISVGLGVRSFFGIRI